MSMPDVEMQLRVVRSFIAECPELAHALFGPNPECDSTSAPAQFAAIAQLVQSEHKAGRLDT